MNNPSGNSSLETAKLTLREMAGQLFMPAAFINDTESEIQQLELLIREYGPGGLCFFHSRASAATNFEGKKKIQFNANSLDRLKELISRYQAASKYPLLIAMDAEWGLAMRVENTPQYPFALALGAMADNNPLLYETGLRMAQDCRNAGIHWNLAPVVDCNTNPNNPVIGYRSFGSRVHAVAAKAKLVFEGMRDGGLLTCAKHFPGHGDTAVDSHLALPVLEKTIEALELEELIPFKHLIDAGIPAVMTGHLSVPAIDPSGTPASLSKPIIAGLLREKLGFTGLVITDALNMYAVSKRHAQPGMTAFTAFAAGNDMLCFAEHIPEALELILQAGDTEGIAERFNRIWNTKQEVFSPNRTLKVSELTPESLNEKLGLACFTNLGPLDFSSFPKAEPFTLLDSGTQTQIFSDRIKNEGPPKISIAWDWSSDNASAFPIPNTHRVLLALAPPSIKPPNRFGISDVALQALAKLLETREVWVFHFGNPYALSVLNLHSVVGVVVAYQHLPEFQSVAANHFLYNTGLSGVLPFDLLER